MWIFCKDGFVSVVQDWNNSTSVVVRGRNRDDLLNVAKAMKINPKTVQTTPLNDYRYRFSATKRQWADYIYQCSIDIDYINFKGRVHEKIDPLRNDAYMKCWGAMGEYQDQLVDKILKKAAKTAKRQGIKNRK